MAPKKRVPSRREVLRKEAATALSALRRGRKRQRKLKLALQAEVVSNSILKAAWTASEDRLHAEFPDEAIDGDESNDDSDRS